MTERKGVDRRAFLKTTGAVALGGALAACGDDPIGVRADGADGDSAPVPDLTDDSSAPDLDDSAVDTFDGGPDATDATADTTEPADTIEPVDTTGPETVVSALTPLRRDGSSPLDYIDHIVIVEMENRSFDHYFGALKLIEGRGDVDGLVAEHGNADKDGTFHNVYPAQGLWVVEPDPPHGAGACRDQFADGANSGFITTYQDKGADAETKRQVVSYMVRDELPALYALADAYTLCDRWHCALLGPTWPNRFYSHAATSEGLTVNLVPLASPSIYTKALAAGVSYGIYHQSPIYFGLTLLDPPAGSFPSKDLDDFFVDAADGTLPQITVVEPDYSLDDDHPPHDIRLGQAFIASIYEALRQSPKWDRTLMVVFYDEHGGFFDHVPPPTIEGDARAALGFDRLGFRVPGLVLGGLVKRGHVLHELVEHCSVPKLIADTFGLDPINERAALAGDLSKALDLDLIVDAKRPAPIALPTIELPAQRVEAAMRGRFRQPELLAFAKARGYSLGTLADKRARVARWLARAEKLGAVRIT